MYVRMTTLTFRVEKSDEGIRLFDESVVPAARAQKGFRGVTSSPTARPAAASP